jgi:hypothetical protein
MACLQGEQPAAIFYPFGHPTPYTYDYWSLTQFVQELTQVEFASF